MLRFLAAAAVMWAHLRFVVGPTTNPLVLTDVGSIGVDVFFVISGYVISLTAAKLGRDYRRFFAHRVARIVPNYYLFSGVFLAHDVLLHGEFGGLREAWNTLLFLPLLDTSHLTLPAHSFGWTLSFEMWFYLVFGLALAGVGAERARRVMPAVLAAGVLLVGLLYGGGWYFPRFAFHPMVLEFCAGCLLFEYRHRLRALAPAAWLALPVLGYGAAVTERLGWNVEVLADPFLGGARAAIWGAFAVCLVIAVVAWDQRRGTPLPRWLTLPGDASYSLYLLQLIPLVLLRRVATELGGWGGVLFVVSSVAGSIVFYRFVERPLSGWARVRLERWWVPT